MQPERTETTATKKTDSHFFLTTKVNYLFYLSISLLPHNIYQSCQMIRSRFELSKQFFNIYMNNVKKQKNARLCKHTMKNLHKVIDPLSFDKVVISFMLQPFCTVTVSIPSRYSTPSLRGHFQMASALLCKCTNLLMQND